MNDCVASLNSVSKAVVITEIKLKQNKRKTMFCFSEIVLFQFCFSVFICDTKR